MLTLQGTGGFSIDASVRIEGHDRHSLERLVRYCARPPFALHRLHAVRGTTTLTSPHARLRPQVIALRGSQSADAPALIQDEVEPSEASSPEAGGARWYDVLRPDGGYVRSVIVPEPIVDEPPPFITEDALYGVVTDPATGIQRVVALSIGPDP